MQPRELLDAAREQAESLIGRSVESVSSLDRGDDDSWIVRLEVVELERVPNTMDLIASYEIRLSDDGDLLGFDRRRRYHRAAEDDGRG